MLHAARSVMLLSLALALAACGGKGKATTPEQGGAPFDQEAVKAQLAASPADAADGCAMEGATTIADTMRMQRARFEAETPAPSEGFRCQASAVADQVWECTWEIARPPGGGEEDEGSAFQVIAQVGADGNLLPGQVLCVAPG